MTAASSIKVTTFLGTRPEIVRLSEIIKLLDATVHHRLIHTGQNSDPNLTDVFFHELELRSPDLILTHSHQTVGDFISQLMIKVESELVQNRPDAVVVLGDTNSSLSAIIAKRMLIPVYHLEAGNRSFDSNVPEETNRRILDHIADFNFPYSELARTNLLNEGLHPRRIFLLGSPLYEVIEKNLQKIDKSLILRELHLTSQGYFLVSIHRQENVDSVRRLTRLASLLNLIAHQFQMPIIISTHPRTQDKLQRLNFEFDSLIQFHEPFGFLAYSQLQKNARLVLSDSGTISEEAAILGFPAITVRDSMERPEALEAGAIVMSGTDPENILELIRIVENTAIGPTPEEYLTRNTSSRFLRVLISTYHQHSLWSGLHARGEA